MKRILSLIMVVVMLFAVSATSVSAMSIETQVDISRDMRLTEVFNMRIAELESQANDLLELSGDNAIDIQISQVSTISDFAGNSYTLVECTPSGYMIYHDASGVFVEASAVAPSPYAGTNGQKIYGGPNEYYTIAQVEGETVFEYTKTDEVILASDVAVYAEASETLNDVLVENQNVAVLNYVENNQPLNLVSPTSTEVNGITYVKSRSFLTSLLRPGYTTIDGSGICGYIAATMLLAYEQFANSTGTFNPADYWWDSSLSGYVINSEFTEDLYELGESLGYGTSTTSVAIHYTVKKYLENEDVDATHTSLYSPIANNITIANKIKDDRPVIWFGLISEYSTGDRTNLTHAVLVYGYDYSLLGGYGFVAHFGWNDASIVTYSGVLGSMYTFTVD